MRGKGRGEMVMTGAVTSQSNNFSTFCSRMAYPAKQLASLDVTIPCCLVKRRVAVCINAERQGRRCEAVRDSIERGERGASIQSRHPSAIQRMAREGVWSKSPPSPPKKSKQFSISTPEKCQRFVPLEGPAPSEKAKRNSFCIRMLPAISPPDCSRRPATKC